MLLHGASPDYPGLSWGLAAASGLTGRQVCAPDLPAGADELGADHSIPGYVRVVTRLLDDLGPDRPVIAGVSMGAAVALGAALARPERVNGLVLVSALGLGSRLPYPLISYPLSRVRALSRAYHAVRVRSPRLVRWGLRRAFVVPQSVTDELVADVGLALRRAGVEKLAHAWRRSEITAGGWRTDYTPHLRRITVPTLIVHGERDRLVPVAVARHAHDLLPDSRLRVFEDCGHWPQREKPEAFGRELADFLAELEESDAA